MSTGIYEAAGLIWKAMRADYEDELERRIHAADEACHGYLVNEAGRTAGVSGESLFRGPEARAWRYASRELADHWAECPRLTLADYEQQWLIAQGGLTRFTCEIEGIELP